MKQDPLKIAVGNFDESKMVITLSKKECKVIPKIRMVKKLKSYGSGGIIEGKEEIIENITERFVYYNDEKIGIIDEYNLMFQNRNRYKVILDKSYRDIFPKDYGF